MMLARHSRANRMYRDFAWSAIAIVTIGLCCGCSSRAKPPDAKIAVTPVSTIKPPGPILIHGKANVIGGAGGEIPFTLELPPGWTWSDGQAEKSISSAQTILVTLTASELPDDEKAERPNAAARRRLVELPDEKMLNDLAAGGKVTI